MVCFSVYKCKYCFDINNHILKICKIIQSKEDKKKINTTINWLSCIKNNKPPLWFLKICKNFVLGEELYQFWIYISSKMHSSFLPYRWKKSLHSQSYGNIFWRSDGENEQADWANLYAVLVL